MPEKDFQENTGETATVQNEDDTWEQIHKDEVLARSMSHDHGRSSGKMHSWLKVSCVIHCLCCASNFSLV